MNCTTSSTVKITWMEIIKVGRHVILTRVPFNWVPWYPGGSLTTCYYVHIFNFYLKQMLPTIISDRILHYLRIKPVLMRIHRRISKGYEMFHSCTSNQWNFVNDKFVNIRDKLLNEREKSIYYIDYNLDVEEYFTTCIVGARRYVMRKPDETLPMVKRHRKV